ncbi:P-loop NTPase fold protein [Salinibacterium sp. ZJ450]|uniref:KAP family P-loop NTPase fold protein n=1 Tax=Salinibacterium sp. ZJ450 TaxID=2708338 RepID=UPI001421E6EF|nr:P-loop NTPase fold protein [Salinibacterium sp. ZJ450]
MTDSKTPPVDNPIKSSNEDVLGRALVAHDFARSIRQIDASQGIVIGVLGAWGHGKSSFVNLMREQFAEEPELPVIEFNPWMFSGTQQLTDVFFREIAAELRLKDTTKFGAIAEGLDKYGDVLSPLAVIPWFGGWFDRAFNATKTAAAWWNNRKKGSRTFRDIVTSALEQLTHPIVVVIDDIDRLTTAEIRDMFRLVRLTASFPNVVYVLAFDRLRVEQALTEDGVPGRSYLEKIVQLSFDVPAIPREILRSQVFERLSAVLEDVEDFRFNQSAWADVYFEIVEPLMKSLRDATRLALSARPTIRALGGEVETVDLLALEAIRVFRPELFQQLHACRTTLTETHAPFARTETGRGKADMERLLDVAGEDADLIRHLVRRVFPAALFYTENTSYGSDFLDTWKREHRVAHIAYLDLYFSRTAPDELDAFRHAERAYALFADADGLGAYLDSLQPEKLEDVISALGMFKDEYPAEAVVPASVALLNRISKIPERRGRGVFDSIRPDSLVARVVLRLLQRLDDDAARERAVREILPRVASFSSQEMLIRDARSGLVSEEAATELESNLIARVLREHSPVPQDEWALLHVYHLVAEHEGDAYVPPSFSDPVEIRALIQSARSVARSQSIDSRTVREEERLVWDSLLRVVGGEEALNSAIVLLRQSDGDVPLVQLAEKYAGGWRPKEV